MTKLPRIPGPKRPQHKLDLLIDDLEGARTLYEHILAKHARFHAAVRDPASVKPGDGGRPLRHFEPSDPMEEWTDVTDVPGLQVGLLEKQGLVLTIKIAGRYYSRPA
ncbi:MAG: hypothetical protein ACK2U9_21185 [Anaerolineae bacterium]